MPEPRTTGTVPDVLLRLTMLYTGLALFGLGIGLLVLADLGVPPWDVFHTGLADLLGWSLGPTIVVVSFVVLLAWIPLHERPGLGTVSNAMLVGLFIDAVGALLPEHTPDSLAVRVALVVGGITINGVATGMYIGASFGPGPRDGLMTALAGERGGRTWTVRGVRTAIEVTVLAAGIALGGSVGVGTVAFALLIGPIAHRTIPFFTALTERARPVPAAALLTTPVAGD